MSSSISYNCCFRSVGRVVSTQKSPVSYPPPPPLIIIPLSNPIYIKDTFKYQLHTCNYLLMKSRNIMYSNFINNIYMTNIIKELINTWITRPILKLFKTWMLIPIGLDGHLSTIFLILNYQGIWSMNPNTNLL